MSTFKNIALAPKVLPLLIAAVFAGSVLYPAVSAAAPATASAKSEVKRFVLKTGIVGGKMVYIDQSGKVNPDLRVNQGDTVELVVTSGEGAEHDIAIPELNQTSAKFKGGSAPVTLRFKADKAGKFTYICTVPGHRQIGMVGVFEVVAKAGAPAAKAGAAAPKTAAFVPAVVAIGPAAADAVNIAMDPNAVPPAITDSAPQFRKYRIETVELNGKLDDGTTFTYWTFDRKVPGPMLRVRVGDTVELTLANAKNSTQIHSIDLHAVTGGHGGGEHTQLAPGQESTITFKALNPGLYVYHCATPSVPHHISTGMYGMILVEPEGGLPPVDKEFYVMQGDIYTKHKHGTKGHQDFDMDKMADEMPDYYVFNGAVGALTKEHKMTAKVGDTVRVYFGVGGPNKISSFHVIGEIFDKVYSEGSISTVKKDVQTTLVPAGGATIGEFKLEYPGSYLLVDHALSRAGKGLVGKIDVTGPPDSTVYKATAPAATSGH
jgi:nitrite reductase (NO-forming)